MNYIVLDLEWNQGKPEKHIREMPFEIVEIGAVKLNSSYKVMDSFRVLIKPEVYQELNYDIHKVVPLDMDEIQQKGVGFREAVRRFKRWCGSEEFRFCTWGSMDLTELQRNMRYHRIKPFFDIPVFYYDIQRCYGLQFPSQKKLCALETAVMQMEIERKETFHRALEDAEYTVAIMQRMDRAYIDENVSVDCYRNPKRRSEELHISYADYELFISRQFEKRERLLRDREVRSCRCIRCNRNMKRVLQWHAFKKGIYLCIGVCQEHGNMIGKVRLKKTDQGFYYAEKTIKKADLEEIQQIKLRYEKILEKRKEKKQKRSRKDTAFKY